MSSSVGIKLDDIEFLTKRCSDLTSEEIQQCSKLFSEHYGVWGPDEPRGKKGKRIQLKENYYEDFKTKKDYFVSLAYYNKQLIGQAFYIRKAFSQGEYFSWVLQLVVHSNYRNMSIGRTLLYSIWGFSGDSAWGLATSNPYTVKTLESATFRKVEPKYVFKNLEYVKKLGNEIDFVKDRNYDVDDYRSIINTEFYIDHSDIKDKIEKAYEDNWILGDLPAGYEWLAFTFKEQEIRAFTKDEFEDMIQYSEKQLKEAYSRMDMENQGWARCAKEEVNFILTQVDIPKEARIADFGCGRGRHCFEFFEKGYNIVGLDFVKANIEKANINRANKGYLESDLSFIEADCRKVNLDNTYNLIICLYDVIGSFPNEIDNMDILKNIYKHTNKNGYAVISVMNMELTNSIAKHRADIFKDPKSLLNLKPSNIMQTKGNIFDPEHYLIDIKSNLVYRKEQFENDGHLSAEHVIRDKRYTRNEICNMAKEVGFEVIESRYVRAGEWDKCLEATHKNAKEILLVLKKN